MSAIIAIGSCQNLINTPTVWFVRSGPDISSLLRDSPLHSALQLNTSLSLLALLSLYTPIALSRRFSIFFCVTLFKQSIHEFLVMTQEGWISFSQQEV